MLRPVFEHEGSLIFQAYSFSHSLLLFVFTLLHTEKALGICGVQKATTGDTGPCGVCWYMQREWATAVCAKSVGALHSHHRVSRKRGWWLCVCVRQIKGFSHL